MSAYADSRLPGAAASNKVLEVTGLVGYSSGIIGEDMRRLRLFGPVCVDRFHQKQKNKKNAEDDRNTDDVPRFRSRRTIALLGYLAAEQRPVARDFLAALFWPDEAPSKGRASLRRELYNLSNILPDCWKLDHQAVAFVPSTDTTVDIFTLLELERQDRWGEAAELLSGEFLEGLYLDHNAEFEHWLLIERERWRGRAEAILSRVIEGSTRRGRYTIALSQNRRLLQFSPWNERAHKQSMRLLAWTGQRGAALRQFETCRRVLRKELDIEPEEKTIDLYRQIQAGKLDLPPQLPAFLTEEIARHEFERPPFVGREAELAQLDVFLEGTLEGQGQVLFITGGPGRGKTALLEAFARCAMKMNPNLLVASGKCNAYSGVGDPYLPYRDLMAMLTGDVEGRWDAGSITRDHAQRLWTSMPLVVQALLDHGPNLLDILVPGEALLSRAEIVEGADAHWIPRLREQVNRRETSSLEAEQSYLFQQVTNVLLSVARTHPLLLIMDDIQWADAASISLLFHLGRCLAEADSRVLIACAYRPEEVVLDRFSPTSGRSERHPLAKVLSEFKRTFGDLWVKLDQPEEQTGRGFVNALLDAEPNRLTEEFRDALYRRTEAHPLFTVELLRTMKEKGDLLKDAKGCWIEGTTLDWNVFPVRVEAVIEERINRLDPDLQEILNIASVEGEVFTAQVIAKVRNLPEKSVLRWLSHDLEHRHRLVKEQDEVYTNQGVISHYRFSHALFQDYLHTRLCQGEQRLLHGHVAAALEELHDGQLDGIAVQLAYHFLASEDYARACQYFSLAAERAARLYANDEAITHYTKAVELAGKVSPGIVSLARLHRGRGLASERMGEFDQALADHKIFLQLARTAGDNQVEWQALLDMGRLWGSRDYKRTRDYFEEALELSRRMDDPAVLASSLNWMGNWFTNAEDPLKAAEYHQEALDIVKELGGRRELANTLDLLGVAHLMGSNLTASVQYYDQAIELFLELDDRLRLVSGLTGRAASVSMLAFLASVGPAPSPDATSDIIEALQIASDIGAAPGKAWAQWSQGVLHLVRGQFGLAVKVLHNGLLTASEIEHLEYVVGNRFALGIAYTELFSPDQARGQLEKAMSLARELRSPAMIHLTTGALAGACLMMGDLKSVQTNLETVLSPQTPMDTLGKRYCWVRRGELALAQGDPDLALDITDRLINSAPGISPDRVITFLWKLKGEALAVLGCTEEAVPLLEAATKNAVELQERFLEWRLHASLGGLYQAEDRQLDAESEFSIAWELVEELAETVPDGEMKDHFLSQALDRIKVSK
jgi:adenylate cyclase